MGWNISNGERLYRAHANPSESAGELRQAQAVAK